MRGVGACRGTYGVVGVVVESGVEVAAEDGICGGEGMSAGAQSGKEDCGEEHCGVVRWERRIALVT